MRECWMGFERQMNDELCKGVLDGLGMPAE